MKKLILIAALLFASYGAFADEFDDFVGEMRERAENKGNSVRVDKARRIIFMDYKLAGRKSFTEAELAGVREFVMKGLRGDKRFAALIKKYGVTVLYNYISTDQNVFTIVVTPNDL